MSGLFISFEGGEGGGKSTQIGLLKERLESQGYETVLTREPGGPPSAEAIRDLLITGKVDRWDDVTEALLMNAARAENLSKTILPALSQNKIVLCDRFADSSRAYQGAAGGIDETVINALENIVVGAHWPDITFILDLPVEDGLARAGGRGDANRFEDKQQSYHEAVRQGFLKIAAAEPERCHVIDARQSIDNIADKIFAVVEKKLEGSHGG